MTIPRGRRMPLRDEDFEDDEEEPVTLTPGQVGSTDPAHLALAAAGAAWKARQYAEKEDRIRAGRWAEVSRAFSAGAEVTTMTQDRYAVKEDTFSAAMSEDLTPDINPHQRIGVLTDDEIETVMALRRGEATVVPHAALRTTVSEAVNEAAPEGFEDWARRQFAKLGSIVRELEAAELARVNGVVAHARERRLDPLGIGSQIDADGLGDATGMDGGGRALWALMEAAAVRMQVIPEDVWTAARYGQVAITARSDGSRIIRRS